MFRQNLSINLIYALRPTDTHTFMHNSLLYILANLLNCFESFEQFCFESQSSFGRRALKGRRIKEEIDRTDREMRGG